MSKRLLDRTAVHVWDGTPGFDPAFLQAAIVRLRLTLSAERDEGVAGRVRVYEAVSEEHAKRATEALIALGYTARRDWSQV